MRRHFLVTIAFAVLGVLVAAASAGAAGDLLGTDSAGVGVDISGGQDLPPLGSLPECSNTADDDADGTVDLDDADCDGPLDNTEAPTGGGDGDDVTLPDDPGDGVIPDPGDDPGSEGSGGRGGGNSGGNGGGSNAAGGGGESQSSGGAGPDHHSNEPPPDAPRNLDGSPTDANPSLTVADFGPAPIGVPNFVIDQF